MDIYKVKFTSLPGDVFRLLCIKAGETLSQRQIANMSPYFADSCGNSRKAT